MLEKEFDFFKKNHDALFMEYPDKYLVIQGEKVIYAEDTMDAALDVSIKSGMEPGTFLLQLCSNGDNAYTHTFHSRVIFA